MMDRKYGIRTHIIWLMLVPLLIAVIALEAFLLHDRYVELDRDLLTKGQLIARQLASSSEYGVFSNNMIFLQGVAESAFQQPDVKGVAVLNAASHVLLSTGTLGDIKSLQVAASQRLKQVGRDVPLFDDGKVLLVYQPILPTQVDLGEVDGKPAGDQVGAIVLEMSWQQTNKLKVRMLWFSFLGTLGFLLVAAYLVHFASRRIIEPIRNLSDAIHAIGAGNLETRVVVTSHIDELGTLSRGINQMTADLQYERDMLRHRIDQATEQMRTLAFYDTLTGLPNRRLLNDRLNHEFSVSNRSGRYGVVMFLDLDNFKPLNDQYGHAVGDLLLIEVANRIKLCLREIDTVARFGGDEFVVLLSDVDTDYAETVRQARSIAEKICMRLAEPYCLFYQSAGQPETQVIHRCTSSIGVVLFLNHAATQDEIMVRADAAMYQAKSEGRNRICFHETAGLSFE